VIITDPLSSLQEKLRTCILCKNIKKILAKGMCSRCYFSERRRTDPKVACKDCGRSVSKVRLKGGICENCFSRKKGLRVRRKLIQAKGDFCAGCKKTAKGRYRSLEFHHTDPSTKSFSLTIYECGRRSRLVIEQEAAKCKVLCKTCHMIAHGMHPDKMRVF